MRMLAAQKYVKMTCRAEIAMQALIAQLLALLAEAAEAADRCDGGALSEEKNPAEEARPVCCGHVDVKSCKAVLRVTSLTREDVSWVTNLVLATLAEHLGQTSESTAVNTQLPEPVQAYWLTTTLWIFPCHRLS